MSDTTIEFGGIEFNAKALYHAIQENLTEDDEAHYGWNTTGLTITDEVVIVGDGCPDPDATVADIESEETIVEDLTVLRDEIEDELQPTTEEYLRDHDEILYANEVVPVGETPISANEVDVVIKHEEESPHFLSRLKASEAEALNEDERVSIGPIKVKDDALYVGILDSQ